MPPLEEFRLLFQKKLRSFESGKDSPLAEAYRRAYQLGEKLIRRHVASDAEKEGEEC